MTTLRFGISLGARTVCIFKKINTKKIHFRPKKTNFC